MAGGAETPNIAALPAIVLIGAGSGRRSAREAIDLSNDEGVTLGRLFTTDSWYMGSNVDGKPRRLLSYIGGVGNYNRQCDELAANGYQGFAMT